MARRIRNKPQSKTTLSGDIARILRGNSLMTGVALAVLQAQPASALSLGELRVQSALGQPLVATTTARIGPGESISSACVTTPAIADGLGNPDGMKVAVREGNTPGNYPVQIRTTRPLYEPMYEIRLQVDCPGSVALAKSYVIMLNLPMSGPAVASANESRRTERLSDVQTRTMARVPASAQSNGSANRSESRSGNRRLTSSKAAVPAGQDYRIRSGDTLSMIAQRVDGRPAGSTWRVAEMIYQNNPQAFIRGNRDMIKLGVVLRIPSVSEMNGAAPQTEPLNAVSPALVDSPVETRVDNKEPAAESGSVAPVTLGRPEEDATAARISNAELLNEIRARNEAQQELEQQAQVAAEIAAEAAAVEIAAAETAGTPALTATTENDSGLSEAPPNNPTSSASVATDTANSAPSAGSNPLVAVLAGIGLGALLALLLLGRNFLGPLLEGRARRKAARATSGVTDKAEAQKDKFATMEIGSAPKRPAYGGGGIDVEVGDNAAAVEASQVLANPFVESDDVVDNTSTDEDEADNSPTIDTPAAAPRVSLRGESDAPDISTEFDSMLEDLDTNDLEKTERFQAPAPGSDPAQSGQTSALEDAGTMRSLFEDTENSARQDEEVTAEMPDYESPTVEMAADNQSQTAELPALEASTANADDTASEEVADIDITDLDSLSRRLSETEDDDRLSATLTQALHLLEQDYEDEFTQSQILEQKDVVEAFAQHKQKD